MSPMKPLNFAEAAQFLRMSRSSLYQRKRRLCRHCLNKEDRLVA